MSKTNGHAPDPRPLLTLADGTTVRADEMWEPREGDKCETVARVGDDAYCRAHGAATWRRADLLPWPQWGDAWTKPRHRVYPPPDLRETLRAETRRVMLAEQIAALRPGDEIEVTHGGRRTWARVIGGWEVARGRFVRGRTTLGMVVTTHAAHISEVRVERDEGVRQHWVGRHT